MKDIKPGSVIRAAYRWPDDKHRDDGQKYRPCLVLKVSPEALVVAPMSTVPPSRDEERYSRQLSAAEQRSLGLSTDKRSWIKANHVNSIGLPSTAIVPVETRNQAAQWTHGTMSANTTQQVATMVREASVAGQLKTAVIRRDNLDAYRSSSVNKTDPSMTRSMPGDPASVQERQQRIEAQARRLHEAAPARPKLRLKTDDPRSR